MSFKPITVSQLSTYVKQIFDAEELLHGISVVGEISGWSNVRGTAYFTLKDEASALSCVCFTADNFSEFKNGDSVMLIGSVKYYTKTGKLNFNVVKIEPYGESVLYQRFLELKAKLEQNGYFNEDHKKTMPKEIKRIGVVSSEGGAVIQDIINVRTRRNNEIDIVLYPVKVQGTGAEFEIANGIKFFDNYNVDVIVVARGGGSFEDLEPFNTEVVADATYNCNKPIVSAVGHETDFTIIDFCSDLRAPTPSAAAELLCEDKNARAHKIKSLTSMFVTTMQRAYAYKNDSLLANLEKLIENFDYVYQNNQMVFTIGVKEFLKSANLFILREDNRLIRKTDLINKLNPAEVLKLGYASIKSLTGSINSVNQIKINDKIDIKLKDGVISATVLNKRETV